MKKLTLITLIATLLTLSGAPAFAADKIQTPPAPAPAEKKEVRAPFNGKITALDKSAKTIKVGDRTFHVIPSTRIQMAGKPATLDDAKVGDPAGGQYRESEGGKLELVSLRVGPKPDRKAKTDDKK